jgi:hypothetical protein
MLGVHASIIPKIIPWIVVIGAPRVRLCESLPASDATLSEHRGVNVAAAAFPK